MFCSESVGEISTPRYPDDRFCWILPNFFVNDLDKNTKSYIYSPCFSFDNTTWRLAMIRYCHQDYRREYVGLFLWKTPSIDLSSQYSVKLGLKTRSLEVCGVCEGELDPDGCFGEWEFLPTVVLSYHKKEFSFSGLVKIFCEIRLKEEILDGVLQPSVEDDKSENINKDNVKNNVPEAKGVDRLVQNLKQLLVDGHNSDAVLKAGNREFRVHKTILTARSPVFASMFQHDMEEKNSGVVDIPDCSAAAFEVLLSYMYTGSAETMAPNNVFNLYYAADKYQIDDLKAECVEYMKSTLSVDTFCDVIALSLRHSESDLQKAATRFFCGNVKKIIKTVQWQRYLKEYPTHANELYIKAINA